MTLYHGSYVAVDKPDVLVGRRCLDFGRGFYLTSIRSQAEQWAIVTAQRKSRHGVGRLNVYEFDDTLAREMGGKWKSFEAYNLEWLDFVVSCREGEDLWQDYDIIEGGIANDNVIDTVEDYSMGVITAEQALGLLIHKKLNHQLCITRQAVADRCLRYVETIDVKEGEL